MSQLIIEAKRHGRWQELATVHTVYTPVAEGPDSANEEPDEIETMANAAFILRAVNCHDELVEAAKLALGLLDPGPPMIIDHADCECFRVRRSVTDKLKAALTKATA